MEHGHKEDWLERLKCQNNVEQQVKATNGLMMDRFTRFFFSSWKTLSSKEIPKKT
jgi:hypothetical protein